MVVEKFAGTVVSIDDEVVAKVTGITTPNLSISESDITGSEDVASGGDILQQQFASIGVSEVATVEGVVMTDDAGQSDLQDAANQGATVEIEHLRPNGSGSTLSGFFTSYQQTRGTGDVAKWTASFRVNSNTPVVAGS